MTDEMVWEYGVRYDHAPRLQAVGAEPRPHPKIGKRINWGEVTDLGVERSERWARWCINSPVDPRADVRRVLVRRRVSTVIEEVE